MSICARQERFCFRKDKSDKHQKIRPLPYTIERCTIRYTEEEEKKEEEEEDEEDCAFIAFRPTCFARRLAIRNIHAAREVTLSRF